MITEYTIKISPLIINTITENKIKHITIVKLINLRQKNTITHYVIMKINQNSKHIS